MNCCVFTIAAVYQRASARRQWRSGVKNVHSRIKARCLCPALYPTEMTLPRQPSQQDGDKNSSVIRLGTLLVTLLTHVGLAVWSVGKPAGQTIRESVMFGCVTVLGAGLYAGLYAVLRRRSSVFSGMPLLTIGNIWTYVYGVGIMGFTMLYCLSGANLVCICFAFSTLFLVFLLFFLNTASCFL